MQYNNYISMIELQNQAIYEPLLDPLGPLYFFPDHCKERSNRFGSPIIAYVAQDNQIESDMIMQLEMLFEKQIYLQEYLVPAFVMALSNVSDSQSIPVFAQLFAGGTSN